MKDTLFLRFLYNTVIGRIILKLMISPKTSRLVGGFLSSPMSKGIISGFIKKNKIEMERFLVPEDGFKSFNDFFTRRLAEPPAFNPAADFISPCDAFLTVKEINDESVFSLKNSYYSAESLLRDKELAERFKGGTALIFRLTPAHYHHYIYCASGEIKRTEKIKGVLHCVRPVALERYKVFSENAREYSFMESEKMGPLVQMEIGAMNVGKITNDPCMKAGYKASMGEEKGYFEFGGSTIVVLLEKRVRVKEEILTRMNEGMEIPVKIGEELF